VNSRSDLKLEVGFQKGKVFLRLKTTNGEISTCSTYDRPDPICNRKAAEISAWLLNALE